MPFEKYEQEFNDALRKGRIKESYETFKVKLFLDKAENSLLIAEHNKNIIPTKNEAKKIHWNYWAITISYYAMLYATKAIILTKGYEVRDHDAAQIALAHLLVPDDLEREDLEILEKSHKIFEDEYVHFFEDAKVESHIARYSAVKSYTERRLEEIFNNAYKFVGKIKLILDEQS